MFAHPNAITHYFVSKIILNLHSDASFQSASRARSGAGGYFFRVDLPEDNKPIKLNSAIYVLCSIPKLVAVSATEAELGALFFNTQEVKIMHLILMELGHPHPPMSNHINNSTCVVIVNNTPKRTCHMQWRISNFGSGTAKLRSSLNFICTQERIIWAITHPKHTWGQFTNIYAPSTYIQITPQLSYQEQLHPALDKGVLKP